MSALSVAWLLPSTENRRSICRRSVSSLLQTEGREQAEGTGTHEIPSKPTLPSDQDCSEAHSMHCAKSEAVVALIVSTVQRSVLNLMMLPWRLAHETLCGVSVAASQHIWTHTHRGLAKPTFVHADNYVAIGGPVLCTTSALPHGVLSSLDTLGPGVSQAEYLLFCSSGTSFQDPG